MRAGRSSSSGERGAWKLGIARLPSLRLPSVPPPAEFSFFIHFRSSSAPLRPLIDASSIMLRTGASRLALRSIPASAIRPAGSLRVAPLVAQHATQFSSIASRRPQSPPVAQFKPIQAAILRRTLTNERKEAEKRYAKEEIKPTPETVSATSSIHPVLGEVTGEAQPPQEMKVSKGIAGDLVCIPHQGPRSIR
jgi:hypothetical protein